MYVYTPEMVVCEKIRAICQQMEGHAKSVQKRRMARARDFFDITTVCEHTHIDFGSSDILDLICKMFNAKRVPLESLRRIEDDRNLHILNWDAVRNTVDQRLKLRDFGFYFDFVRDKCEQIATALKV